MTTSNFGTVFLFISLSIAGRSCAALPAAPSGFTWQYVSSSSYSDADSGTLSLNGIQTNLGTPTVTPISQSLSLTTFNQASAPSGQYYCITSSLFSTSLLGATSVELYNSTGASRDFSGNLSLTGMTIGGTSGATAGPVTASINRPVVNPQVIAGKATATFIDAVSGATATNLNVSAGGTVPADDGSNISFTYTGSNDAALSGGFAAAGYTISGAINYSATLTTNYDIYELVPIVPEPGVQLLGLAALAGLALRRRRA